MWWLDVSRPQLARCKTAKFGRPATGGFAGGWHRRESRERASVEAVSIRKAILAPGMQHHRDKSADGGDEDHCGDRYTDIGEILRGRWCLKERSLAAPAFRHRKVYGFSASRTYSFHRSLSSVAAICWPDLLTIVA